MHKPISTGIASFGMSGYVFHAPLLHVNKGFEISAIVERNNELSRENYSYSELVRSIEELCTNPEIELIIINLPDHLHFEYAKMALNAGKHVVIEKPFTQTSAEADELIKIAESKKLVLSVFQNRRWDNDFLTIRKILGENKLGTLIDYEAHFDRYRNEIKAGTWKEESFSGAGTLFNLGSHLIDQALCLFGWPDSVYADIRVTRPGGIIDDNFELILRYGNLKVILKASYLVKEPGPRYILHGTDGSYLKWGIDPQEDDLKDGKMPDEENWGIEDFHFDGLLNYTEDGKEVREKIKSVPGNYNAYYDNIYSAIRGKEELAVKAKEARDVIRIIEAAFESEKEKKVILL
jgi:scyllo-inositol 2-dehydrogenase (NADP+)